MTDNIPTVFVGDAVNLASHYSGGVTNSLLQTNCRGPLEVAGVAINDLGDIEANAAVYARGCDKDGKVQHGCRRHRNAERHCVANGGDDCEWHHEEDTAVEPIRAKCDDQIYHRRPNLHRYG